MRDAFLGRMFLCVGSLTSERPAMGTKRYRDKLCGILCASMNCSCRDDGLRLTSLEKGATSLSGSGRSNAGLFSRHSRRTWIRNGRDNASRHQWRHRAERSAVREVDRFRQALGPLWLPLR